MNETEKQAEPEYTRIVGVPGVMFSCPKCEAASAIPGPRAVVQITGGGILRLQCSKCGQHIEIWQGEQPRIVQPRPGDLNRHQRRAKAKAKRLILAE